MTSPPTPLTAPKLAYSVGDPCWIYMGEGDLAAGHVVHWFYVTGHPNAWYVIKLDDPDFMILETRDALLMASTADGALPYARGV